MSELGNRLRRLADNADDHPDWTFVVAIAGETLLHNFYSAKPNEMDAFVDILRKIAKVLPPLDA